MRELTKFALDWMREKPFAFPLDWRYSHGKVSSLILYRKGNLQTQLFHADGELKVPKHTHPNVESMELALDGEFNLQSKGRGLRHGFFEVEAGIEHWGYGISPLFLSFQRWLNGVQPTSIVLDWEGEDLEQANA